MWLSGISEKASIIDCKQKSQFYLFCYNINWTNFHWYTKTENFQNPCSRETDSTIWLPSCGRSALPVSLDGLKRFHHLKHKFLLYLQNFVICPILLYFLYLFIWVFEKWCQNRAHLLNPHCNPSVPISPQESLLIHSLSFWCISLLYSSPSPPHSPSSSFSPSSFLELAYYSPQSKFLGIKSMINLT